MARIYRNSETGPTIKHTCLNPTQAHTTHVAYNTKPNKYLYPLNIQTLKFQVKEEKKSVKKWVPGKKIYRTFFQHL